MDPGENRRERPSRRRRAGKGKTSPEQERGVTAEKWRRKRGRDAAGSVGGSLAEDAAGGGVRRGETLLGLSSPSSVRQVSQKDTIQEVNSVYSEKCVGAEVK